MGKKSKKGSNDNKMIRHNNTAAAHAPFSSQLANSTFLHIVCLIFLIAIIYSNAYHVPFQFDDINNLKNNHVIRSLGNFISSSKGYDYNPRRFIGYFSFALNYHFGGLDVRGYHIVNLAIHTASSILVYFMVLLTFRTPLMKSPESRVPKIIALFAGLLFAVHPVQTQAVTYIVQRFASLAAMFYLMSVVFYIKARLIDRADYPSPFTFHISHFTFFLISFLSAVLAMKTKEIAFTLPVMVVLYEFVFFESTMKKRLIFIVPALCTMLIIPISIIGTKKPLGEVLSDMSEMLRVTSQISRWDYFMTQMRVITTYIRLIFLPVNQNLDYDYPVSHSFFSLPVLLSFVFLSALFGMGVYFIRSSRFTTHDSRLFRLTGFGILWFFITLSVESSIIPITDVIFEHRLYLPSAGAFIAVTTSAFIVAGRLSARWKGLERAVIIAFALIPLPSRQPLMQGTWSGRMV